MAGPIYNIATKSFTSLQKLYDPHKPSLQKIFFDQWPDFVLDPQVIKNGLRDVTSSEVLKMIGCGTIDSGFEVYECPNCHNSHIICYTCKSRFCNSCGVKYAKARAINISNITLDVNHRHIVFTIDDSLRDYFKKDRSLHTILFNSVKETLFYTFNTLAKKNNSCTPGFILTLHTFGRSLSYNPHIHALVTEGGMNDAGHYQPIKYLNYELLRKSFMRTLLYNMRDSFDPNSLEIRKFKRLIAKLYEQHENGFYVYAPPLKYKNNNAIVNYIIRYTARPAMAQSRILDYSKEKKLVKYYYQDHKTNERIEVIEHVFLFMKKLLIHIPEKQFKMLRYYGLYATTKHSKKKSVKILIANSCRIIKKIISYRKDLIETFGVDPLLCSCGHYMEFVDYYVPSKGGAMNGPIACIV